MRSSAGVSCATQASSQCAGLLKEPASMVSSSFSSAKRVDLPQPFLPTKPTLSPG
ncbi:Uncharacterised protein [Vibrio cholerae]|nr:Uncharacterised protein [Vibrio cholerae]